jgi:hypothetical protein
MKIIDKTPLVDQKGDLGFTQRIQGMLRYGFRWPAELQAQKAIVTFFDRNLEKGYTLLRNVTLGQSEIMIPLILLGPAGIFTVNLTFLRGRYEAKGDSWNVESGGQFRPAPVNLVRVTARMARALQVFIERQGMKLPAGVEPILIAGDPGLHIDSTRPAIKVLMIDGIKSWVTGLAGNAPVLNALTVNEAVERILEPRAPRQEPISSPAKSAAREPEWQPEQGQPASRARAIFNASEESKPLDPSEFDFAMVDEGSDVLAAKASASASEQAGTGAEPRARGRRVFGMTPVQLAVIGALALCLICILVVGFSYVIPAFS